jgi:hypothetical protein
MLAGTLATRPLFVRDPFLGLEPIERLTWERIANPVLTPAGGAEWDGSNIYMPIIVRNLDRTPYQDGLGKYYMYYIGGAVFDQSGLALGTDFDTWTRWPSNPVLPLGASNPDDGDTQITSAWWSGTEFVIYYQGNSNESEVGSDNVTVCLATSPDGKAMTRLGSVLTQGAGGDASDLYVPKLIPAGHNGLPRLYYTGQTGTTRGLMCAVSLSGNIRGPWTRLSDDHLFQDESTFLGDAWYADGLYHFIYCPITGGVAGVWYANSEDGVTITKRRILLPRNTGGWDTAPLNASWLQKDGIDYLFFGSTSSIGIGYVFAD